jgi:uncharacterized membrane protein
LGDKKSGIARGRVAVLGVGVAPPAVVSSGVYAAVREATESNLQLTSPLVWTMIAISAAGAIVTFGFLVYAIVKFRDPATRGRRYG